MQIAALNFILTIKFLHEGDKKKKKNQGISESGL